MQINDQGTFYVEGEYKAGDIILTAGDWELKADVDGYKKYAFGYEPDDFPELITNGTFDTDTDWTKGVGWSISGGLAQCDGTLDSAIYQNAGLSQGQLYVLQFEVVAWVFGDVRAEWDSDGLTAYYSAVGSQTVRFTPDSSTLNRPLFRTHPTNGFNGSIDNISVRLAHPKSGDTIQLGNGHHKDFRYYPYKLSATDIQELTR